jgi:hypothetical protein
MGAVVGVIAVAVPATDMVVVTAVATGAVNPSTAVTNS